MFDVSKPVKSIMYKDVYDRKRRVFVDVNEHVRVTNPAGDVHQERQSAGSRALALKAAELRREQRANKRKVQSHE